MRTRQLTVFLTFVLLATSAHTAVNDPSPDFNDPPSNEASGGIVDESLRKSLDIAPAPPAPPVPAERRVRLDYFHKYRKGLSAMVAAVADTKRVQNEEGILTRGTVRYLFHDRDLKAFEGGADLDSDGTGAIHLARRFIYAQTKFRSYEKLGVAVRIDPDDQLGTFLRYQHYQLRGAAGFEYLWREPASYRIELEGSASFHSLQAGIYAGVTWAW